MPGRAARFTQAELERIVRAVRKGGGGVIEADLVKGTISIRVTDKPELTLPEGQQLEPEHEVVL